MIWDWPKLCGHPQETWIFRSPPQSHIGSDGDHRGGGGDGAGGGGGAGSSAAAGGGGGGGGAEGAVEDPHAVLGGVPGLLRLADGGVGPQLPQGSPAGPHHSSPQLHRRGAPPVSGDGPRPHLRGPLHEPAPQDRRLVSIRLLSFLLSFFCWNNWLFWSHLALNHEDVETLLESHQMVLLGNMGRTWFVVVLAFCNEILCQRVFCNELLDSLSDSTLWLSCEVCVGSSEFYGVCSKKFMLLSFWAKFCSLLYKKICFFMCFWVDIMMQIGGTLIF